MFVHVFFKATFENQNAEFISKIVQNTVSLIRLLNHLKTSQSIFQILFSEYEQILV